MSGEELRDIPVEDLEQLFTYADIEEISDHQDAPVDERGSNQIARVAEYRFFPRTVEQKYGRDVLLGALACNTSLYDDEIENFIDDDVVATMLLEAKLSDPGHSELYTRALRIRRSVLAFLSLVDPSVTVVEIPTGPEHNSPTAA